MAIDQYESIRALQALDEERASPDWAGTTNLYPKMEIDPDPTVPMLPAFLRPQA